MLRTGSMFDKHEGVVINITRTVGHPMSPPWKLLKEYKAGKITWADYVVSYNDHLDSLYLREPGVFWEIIKQAQKQDVTLLCYEREPEDRVRCHRILLAKYLRTLAASEGIKV